MGRAYDGYMPKGVPLLRTPTGRKDLKKGNPHVVGKVAKCSGCFPKSRPQEQDSGHRIPRKWRKAAGNNYLVRQFMRIAPARRPLAAGLQARDLDGNAGAAHPALRAWQRERRSLSG